ncbi:MAG: response regulator [Pseudomonadota bacterium]
MTNKRALIVDDSTTAQYRLKKMLRPYNLDTDSVDSGEAALRYLATNAPDVIFMDHLMPGMDGFRALQIIKSHPETAMIPVIMYTSKSGDVYTGQARALGALDVVSKDTITATELSNVMQTIHVYRKDDPERQPKVAPAEETLAPIAKTIDVGNFERNASQANAEQARNLELRLSHMEHTLEDSSRFITSRVVRELQGLKKNIKQEFSEIIQQKNAHVEIPLQPIEPPSESGWSLLSKILILGALGVIAFYLIKMSDAVTQSQDQQQKLGEQLAAIAAQKNVGALIPVAAAPALKNASDLPKQADNAYLADLAWSFNQTSALPFNQSSVDTKTVIRLYELLNRIIAKGFRGTVWINIYVGNFCLVIDNFGQAQLASESLNMGNCITTNEIYGVDRVMEQYQREVETALNGVDQKPEKAVRIIINTLSEPDNYPERKPSLSAKSWNMVAQNHNRLELKLEPTKP